MQGPTLGARCTEVSVLKDVSVKTESTITIIIITL